MGNKVKAAIGYINDGKTAVLEMAQASGLCLVPNGEKNPLAATSYGTGELLQIVLNKGIRDILIGIGGSATNDGGMGAMKALGVKFLDIEGRELFGSGASLESVHRIDISGLNPAVFESHITVICDVTNPLLGKDGATYVYGPQRALNQANWKSLIKAWLIILRLWKTHLVKILLTSQVRSRGGMGAALLAFLNAKLKPGIDVVLDTVNFDKLLDGASFVVTGEGNIDEQSIRFGKVPAGIMKRCAPKMCPL